VVGDKKIRLMFNKIIPRSYDYFSMFTFSFFGKNNCPIMSKTTKYYKKNNKFWGESTNQA
jgi:hypothetical protein